MQCGAATGTQATRCLSHPITPSHVPHIPKGIAARVHLLLHLHLLGVRCVLSGQAGHGNTAGPLAGWARKTVAISVAITRCCLHPLSQHMLQQTLHLVLERALNFCSPELDRNLHSKVYGTYACLNSGWVVHKAANQYIGKKVTYKQTGEGDRQYLGKGKGRRRPAKGLACFVLT